VVVDKTGLAGSYEFTLNFAARPAGGDGAGDDRPSIFTSLQEQLGLKLEPSRSPVEFAVIDYVEKPIVD
jgi:bla regulator protein blaR1